MKNFRIINNANKTELKASEEQVASMMLDTENTEKRLMDIRAVNKARAKALNFIYKNLKIGRSRNIVWNLFVSECLLLNKERAARFKLKVETLEEKSTYFCAKHIFKKTLKKELNLK